MGRLASNDLGDAATDHSVRAALCHNTPHGEGTAWISDAAAPGRAGTVLRGEGDPAVNFLSGPRPFGGLTRGLPCVDRREKLGLA